MLGVCVIVGTRFPHPNGLARYLSSLSIAVPILQLVPTYKLDWCGRDREAAPTESSLNPPPWDLLAPSLSTQLIARYPLDQSIC